MSNALAQLATILQGLQKQAPQGGGSGGGPDIIPGGSKTAPGMSMPQLPPGSMASQLPQNSPGAQPVPPKQLTQPFGPMSQSGYNYDNPKARNAAVVDSAIKSLTQFVDQNKEHKYKQQVEEARGVVSTVLRTSQAVDKANQTQDKETAKLIQDQANKMLGSKEAQKILKDLNKPGSAAYYGAQQAYQDVMKESEQKLSMQEIQAKIQAEQARAQAEEQRAQAEVQRAKSEAPEAKEHLERVKGEEKLKQIEAAQKAITQRTEMTLPARMAEVRARGQFSMQVAQIHASAIRAVAGNKQSKTIADALTKDYSSISRQYTTVVNDMAKLQKEMDEHHTLDWLTGASSEKKAQFAYLQSQRDDLEQQLKMVELKRQTALQYGHIAEDPSADEQIKNLQQMLGSETSPEIQQQQTNDKAEQMILDLLKAPE